MATSTHLQHAGVDGLQGGAFIDVAHAAALLHGGEAGEGQDRGGEAREEPRGRPREAETIKKRASVCA